MKTLRNILVLADGFAAPSYTPRLRFLCQYLSKHGYRVQVVTEHIHPLLFEHDYPIEEIAVYHGKGLLGMVDWAIKNILSLLFDYKNRYFSRQVENMFGHQAWDIVFCTTFHTFPLRAAVTFAHKHHIPVVLDLRDIIEQAPANHQDYLAHHSAWLSPFVRPFQNINRRRRNRWLSKANAVTCVSPWHKQMLKSINPDTHLIYNGFDETVFSPVHCPSPAFILSYTGKYFGLPMQDIRPLLEALQSIDIPYRFEIHTQPEGKKRLLPLLQQYGLGAHCSLGDYIPLSQTIDLYHRSSIIIALSNKAADNNVHGMMTTKFFEALGVEKPLLLVRSDEECLAQTMAYTNAGLAATSKEEIKQFILTRYQEWLTKGVTHQRVQHKDEFTRQHQAEQFEQIFLSLCQK